jgi:peptide/nickel transport system substrate-binding protein
MNTRKKTPLVVLLLAVLLLPAGGLFALPGRDNSPRDTRNNAELRFGLMSEPATLDPLSPSNTADGRALLFNVFEGLVKVDSSGRFLPAVAESIESREALTYTFTLREGLRFHDGSPVRDEDVEFTLNEAKERGYQGFSQIDRIELLGGRRIRVALKEADPDFLPYMSVGIVPKNNPDREKNPIGTGPFMIENYLPQQQLTLVKNPYYRLQDLPKLDKVTVLFTEGNNALYTGLEGGNLTGAMVSGDVAYKLNPNR